MSSVYCKCGAQWHGQYANSENIQFHKRRTNPACEIIDHVEFARLWGPALPMRGMR